MPQPRSISFEFFPPKTTEGEKNLTATHQQLAALNPEYFSVTFGAGGSQRERTLTTVKAIRAESTIDVAPHLSCIESTHESITHYLNEYQAANVRRLVSLRGDIREGVKNTGVFHYASELIRFIRKTTGDYFHIDVAAYPEVHPEAGNADIGLQHFKQKVACGANGAITQYFYNIDAYFYFVDACQRMAVDVPIVPGIMPITNYKQLAEFSAMCGAQIPRWLDKKLQGYAHDLESIRAFGVDFMTDMCQRLLDQDAPGLHFYTLNKAQASLAICHQLQH